MPTLVVAVLAVGCGGGDETGGSEEEKPAPTSSPSASASVDPQSAAEAEVLAVYRNYWDAQIDAYAKASPTDTDLDKYAYDKALTMAETELVALMLNGNIITGEPVISPEVTAINLDESPMKATITDCVDVTDWKLVTAETGEEVPLSEEQLRDPRYVTTATVRTVGDTWMVVEVQPQDRTC
ncbi:hypothetical protein ACFVUW_10340 [Streptomyces xiamenensis]|uniref:hypothetical protein n=1 Tax=Streptomyces xiamenensis TaxID=408015 RepID=UPI0036EE3410